MTMTRRNLIAAGATTLACSFEQGAGAATAPVSLARLASAKGIRFGSTVGHGNFADPAYRRLNAAQCGLIVRETEMKWVALRPDARRFDFRAADAIVAWTRTHDYGARPGTEAARLLQEDVDTVAQRYAGSVDSFDVVNEGIDPDTGLLRETMLSKSIGAENLINMTFCSARRAAPRRTRLQRLHELAVGRRTPSRCRAPSA